MPLNFDGFSVMFLLLGAIVLMVMLMQVTPRGATLASPKRVMRHINKRRQFMGLPALYLGDPTLPEDYVCDATRLQEWRDKQ